MIDERDFIYLKIEISTDRDLLVQILNRNGYMTAPARKKKNGRQYDKYVGLYPRVIDIVEDEEIEG